MLRQLTIRDFVIADRLELEFGPGFTALTGETGAGKSILIDALGLALGERAEAGMVRSGAERAEVSAEFDLPAGSPVAAWLAENGIAADDGVLLLRRVVEAAGRSRAWINGTPATLNQLREVGESLADVHGQHAHHALLRAEAQRRLLDAHGGLAEVAEATAARFREWHRLHEARIEAESGAEASARERELLEWQVKELQALNFEPAEWQETEAAHKRLANAAGLLAGLEGTLGLLDEGEGAAAELVAQAASRLGECVAVDAALADSLELIEGAGVQLREAAVALRRYRDHTDLDPERLAELEARIEAVMSLARKHRLRPEELPERLAELEARLAELSLLHDPAALAEREAAARKEFEAVAAQLSVGRKKTAKALGEAVSHAMQELALAGGRFEVALPAVPEGAAYGLENVEFRVAANPGQAPGPLAKVASGGELSRVGLAIQVVTSAAGDIPTLIFDEVDVGIGGGVAEIVGRMLKALGKDRQVLCVTHLPQVAARADRQWQIAKAQRDGQAVSRVTPLDRQGRVDEIARMLGGVRITDTTRRHAEEMLGLSG